MFDDLISKHESNKSSVSDLCILSSVSHLIGDDMDMYFMFFPFMCNKNPE
jgi:hypothetical protein